MIWNVQALISGPLPAPSDGAPSARGPVGGARRRGRRGGGVGGLGPGGPARAGHGPARGAAPAGLPGRSVPGRRADRGSRQPAVRGPRAATGELGRLGAKAGPALKAGAPRPTDPRGPVPDRAPLGEPGATIPSPELLRAGRAIGVLERIGTDGAASARGAGRGRPADAGGRAGAGRGAALAIAVRRPSEATKAIGHRRRLDARAEADEFPADARPHVEAESSHDGSLDEPGPVPTVDLGSPFVLAKG